MKSRLHFPATLAGLRSGGPGGSAEPDGSAGPGGPAGPGGSAEPGGSRGGRWRRRLTVRPVWCAGFSMLVIGVPAATFAGQAGSAAVQLAAAAATGLGVVPKPVSARIGSGHFTLTPRARIVAAPGAGATAELPVAGD